MERYTLNFGRDNAGGAPSFTTFIRLDTLAAIAEPAITEIGDGWYYFEYDASVAPAGVTQIAYTAICGTGEASSTFTVAAATTESTTGITGTGIATSAPTPYELFFGTANAGGSPAWVRFSRADTHAPLTAPAILEIGNGLYQFTVDWSSQPVTSIEYVASLAGVERSGLIQAAPAAGAISVAAGNYNWTGYVTAKSVINRVLAQVAGKAAVDDPYVSSDPDYILARELLVSVGGDLMKHEWAHLVSRASFVTNGSATSYAMPADYRAMVDNSLWNESMRLPGIGPVSFQQSEALKARLVNIVLNVIYQMQGGMLTFPIVPPAGSSIAFFYRSNFWVKSSGGSVPDKAKPSASDDLLLFDEELLVAGLKVRFLEDRGFDTAIAMSRYESKLEQCLGEVAGASVLSLGGLRRDAFDRMIDGHNIPAGGW